MRIDIITLFPDYFDKPLSLSIVGRAAKKELITIQTHNLRDYAFDRYGTVDDTPYGGGPGMVLKVDVMKQAIDAVAGHDKEKPYIILLTPQGRPFSQTKARELSEMPRIILICGHYEGFDERIRTYVDTEISIGPYVLSGGEPAALVIIDSVTRLIPGATGDMASTHEESHSLMDDSGQPLLEYPHYTRPEEFNGVKVPEVLLSGNHSSIETWRQSQAKARTEHRLQNE